MSRRCTALALLAAALAVGPAAGPARAATGGAAPASPIRHVVVVVLHGATFDSYFGTRHGVDGAGGVTDPAGAPTQRLEDSARAARMAYNGGAMNGFGRAQLRAGKGASAAYAANWQYTAATAPAMWNLADRYVVFDHFFSSHMTDALPNVLSLIGDPQPGITASTPSALGRLWTSTSPTIFDQAQAAGVPWRFYIGRIPKSVTRGSAHPTRPTVSPSNPRASQYYWAPVLSMRRFRTNPQLRSGLSDQSRFYTDAARNRLPAISYVLPSPATHLGLGERTAERRVLSLIAAVQKSSAWSSSVILVVGDSWGGYSDHVIPPVVDGQRQGYRVPALLISPLARSGYVSHHHRDDASVPAMISRTFGLGGHPAGAPAFRGVWSPHVRQVSLLPATPATPYEAMGRAHTQAVKWTYVVGILIAAATLLACAVPKTPLRWRT